MKQPNFIRVTPMPAPKQDPHYRYDEVLRRLAQAGIEWTQGKAQQLLGIRVDLWSGQGGFGEVVDRVLEERGMDGGTITPLSIAENIGLVSKKPKRIRKAG